MGLTVVVRKDVPVPQPETPEQRKAFLEAIKWDKPLSGLLRIDLLTSYPETLKRFKKDEDLLFALRVNGMYLEHIPKDRQTEAICLQAVKTNPAALALVVTQTPKICLEAVKRNAKLAFPLVLDRTDEICIAALHQNVKLHELIKNKSPAVKSFLILKLAKHKGILPSNFSPDLEEDCLRAVQKNPRALEFVTTQTEEICLEAVQRNGNVLELVKSQTDKVCVAAVTQNGLALELVKSQTDEICLEAVNKNGLALQFVNRQTDEICIAAVKQNGLALEFVNNQTDEMNLLAVKRDWSALQFVDSQTEELCLIATEKNWRALNYVQFQSDLVCLAAVRQNPTALAMVDRQWDALCLEAVQRDGMALEYVHRVTPAICEAALEQNPRSLRFVSRAKIDAQKFQIAIAQNKVYRGNIRSVPKEIATPEFIKNAIQENPFIYLNLKDEQRTEELAILAATQNPSLIFRINNPSEATLVAAISAKPAIIKRLEHLNVHLPETVFIEAIRQNQLVAKYVQKPTVEILATLMVTSKKVKSHYNGATKLMIAQAAKLYSERTATEYHPRPDMVSKRFGDLSSQMQRSAVSNSDDGGAEAESSCNRPRN